MSELDSKLRDINFEKWLSESCCDQGKMFMESVRDRTLHGYGTSNFLNVIAISKHITECEICEKDSVFNQIAKLL